MNARRISAVYIAAALAAVLLPAAGCHKKVAPPPPPPPPAAEPVAAPSATLTANPTTTDPGQSVTLSWNSSNASSVSIDGIGTVNASGSQSVSPTATTTYHLVARGDGGSTEATATVTVNQPAPPPAAAPAMTESMFEQSVKPIFFGLDSYTVSDDSKQSITDAAAFLQQHSDIKVLIAGYCDERGSEEYNQTLGQSRADAVKSALVQAGVDGSRLRTISYGKEKPFCTEHNEACWKQNRRGQLSLDQ